MGHRGQEVMKTPEEQTHLNTCKIWWNVLSFQLPDVKDNRQVSVSLAHKDTGVRGTLFAGKARVRISLQWGRLDHLN